MKKLMTLCLITIFLFAGCKKDKGDPPVLPPEESMIIDFSNFDTQKKSADFSGFKGTENSSWEFSAISAATWKLIVFGTLAVPVTSFQMVIDQTPEYVSGKTWQWSYTATIAQATYKARLTGQIMDSEVQWKMYITKDGTGGFNDFLWFEGTSAFDGKSGSWTLYNSNVNNVAILKIDWEKPAADQGKIKYTYVKNDPFKDSFIEYGLKTTSLNAYYTIHYWNGAKFSDVNIEWSTKTHNGRIKSLDYLGDDQWHCWDANRVNVQCP
ncbi:MAG TPA: hypothetical protein VK207_10210 [Bacteroidales bacterium]|nr:hypothetical protein [Bacteroidales bacterium]